jgi:hypothetical protein
VHGASDRDRGTAGTPALDTGSDRRRPRSFAPVGRARVGAALGLAAVAVLGVGAGVRQLEREPALTAPDIGALPGSTAPTGSAVAVAARGGRPTGDPESTPRRPASDGRAHATAGAPAMGALAAVPVGVPVAVTLPGVTAAVVPIGVRPSGQLDLPESPRTVGWWVGSAPAGSPEPTVLAGHVDSRSAGVGALAALRDVTAGDPILLTDAFGERHAYRVEARRTYPKQALPRSVFTGAPLVLITCGGPFDEKSGSYRDNIVVYAAPG